MADDERADLTERSGAGSTDLLADESLDEVVGGVVRPGSPGSEEWDDYWDNFKPGGPLLPGSGGP